MKTLRTLSKLHKHRLTALKKAVSDLEQQKEQLTLALGALAEEMRREIDLASTQVEMGRFFGDYAKRIRTRQKTIDREIETLAASMDLLREKIVEEFSEMKKYDVARDNRLKKQAKEANLREQRHLDEIAVRRFVRQANA